MGWAAQVIADRGIAQADGSGGLAEFIVGFVVCGEGRALGNVCPLPGPRPHIPPGAAVDATVAAQAMMNLVGKLEGRIDMVSLRQVVREGKAVAGREGNAPHKVTGSPP